MSYRLELESDQAPMMPNELRYKHWTFVRKQTKLWLWFVRSLIGQRKPPAPLRSARITFTRYSRKKPDRDNLVYSFKPVLDGLVQCGIILDDKPEVIGSPCYVHRERKNIGIRVVVQELPMDEEEDDG